MPKRMWVLLVAGLGTALCAFGDSTQWLISPATTGSYSYAGGSASLVGSNIAVENVEGVGTPLDSGTLGTMDIVGGELNFTSGAATGAWAWGSPGTLTVTGCIAGVTTTDTTCTVADEAAVLVSDEFTSVTITAIPVAGSPLGIEFGYLQGTINSAVAAVYGVSTAFTSPASTGQDVLLGLPGTAGSPFSGVTSSAPGGTLNLVSAVPEDWGLYSSLGIFGFALAAFGVARRLGLIRVVAF